MCKGIHHGLKIFSKHVEGNHKETHIEKNFLIDEETHRRGAHTYKNILG
jgi:hypothetical protein